MHAGLRNALWTDGYADNASMNADGERFMEGMGMPDEESAKKDEPTGNRNENSKVRIPSYAGNADKPDFRGNHMACGSFGRDAQPIP